MRVSRSNGESNGMEKGTHCEMESEIIQWFLEITLGLLRND